MGSAVNTRLIACGVLAGAVGGLVAFVFARIGAEPIVGHVINIVGVRMQAPSAVDEHGAELLSSSVQATGEMAFAVVSFGAAMGALLAAAFAVTYVRIDSVRPGALALVLAGDAFAALSLVPSVKYRPPLGREAIISQRTGLYLLMVGLSVALVIGGVEIPGTARGLVGWSDADVLTHAVIDALLGAAGLGDIGKHFPDDDPRWRDADSIELLEAVRGMLPGPVGNVDATVICEAPKLSPHRDAMRARLAGALELDTAAVNVKFTTGEGMGFVGRGEGIAALAIATL
jgi:2-C-methyl-D-erythritol 2,4-cyclodiphosphate synthase